MTWILKVRFDAQRRLQWTRESVPNRQAGTGKCWQGLDWFYDKDDIFQSRFQEFHSINLACVIQRVFPSMFLDKNQLKKNWRNLSLKGWKAVPFFLFDENSSF